MPLFQEDSVKVLLLFLATLLEPEMVLEYTNSVLRVP